MVDSESSELCYGNALYTTYTIFIHFPFICPLYSCSVYVNTFRDRKINGFFTVVSWNGRRETLFLRRTRVWAFSYPILMGKIIMLDEGWEWVRERERARERKKENEETQKASDKESQWLVLNYMQHKHSKVLPTK